MDHASHSCITREQKLSSRGLVRLAYQFGSHGLVLSCGPQVGCGLGRHAGSRSVVRARVESTVADAACRNLAGAASLYSMPDVCLPLTQMRCSSR